MDKKRWEQYSVGGWFIVAVALWLTRDLHFVDGWQALFETKIEGEDLFITDTTTAIFVFFCMAIWPKYNIFKGHKYVAMMDWNQIESKFPWSVILLLGGSLAMAEGCDVRLN